MNFDSAFTKLLGHEGGYVNNSADPGGETNWGISKRSYPTLHIASLTQFDAMGIYKRDFWDKCRCDDLPSDARYAVFDAAVNSGVAQSVKWLQAALGTGQDGVVGPVTLAAANTLPGTVIAARHCGYRLAFMTELKTFKDFGTGWVRRVASIIREA